MSEPCSTRVLDGCLPIPALPLPCWMTRGKLLPLSKPQFPHLRRELPGTPLPSSREPAHFSEVLRAWPVAQGPGLGHTCWHASAIRADSSGAGDWLIPRAALLLSFPLDGPWRFQRWGN